MIPGVQRTVWAATAVAVAATGMAAALQTAEPRPLILGLDHIPLAVADLEAASEQYRQLGFTLKPGRHHENGIRNRHIKFSDGTEIELITASGTRDALTAEYLQHIAQGDGPAFVSFFAPEMDRVARHLDAEGVTYGRSDGLLSFPERHRLRYIFFGHRTGSPTDRPGHFRHDNGAEALIGVWIAGNERSAEQKLLAGLGAVIGDEVAWAPESVKTSVARLPLGEVVFLPGSHQRVTGRRIVGATLRVRDLKPLQHVLEKGRWKVPGVVQTGHGPTMFLPPDMTGSIWLEFREVQ